MPYHHGVSKPQTVPIVLDAAELADLDRLAEHMDATREDIARWALLRFISDETPLDQAYAGLPPYVPDDPVEIRLHEAEERYQQALAEFLREGEESIARGELVDHEVFMAELRALDEAARAKRHAA